jgi:lipopolysaccharide/colanic/teichoic acid biosynthesis glycosyltransferase
MIKRLFDITVSLLGLFLVMPLMKLVSLLIKFESKGSVIFRQERVGLLGKTFSIYKFRSMVVDAESQGPHFTSATDVRVTRVGRFIRKTSLDELPQLLSVLFGDMSLVGPRPNVPKQKVEYSESEWDKRNSIRSGITGLAQAKLRSAATLVESTQLDLDYLPNSQTAYFER